MGIDGPRITRWMLSTNRRDNLQTLVPPASRANRLLQVPISVRPVFNSQEVRGPLDRGLPFAAGRQHHMTP